MARQPSQDFSTTLTMLHQAVMHIGTNLQEALDKSVEKLEAGSQAAQARTSKDVTDELGRMRTDFRDVRNKLSFTGETANTELQNAAAALRSELREIRTLLADLTPSTTAPATAGTPGPAATPGPQTASVEPLPTTGAGEPDSLRHEHPLTAAIPIQRSTDQPPHNQPEPGPEPAPEASPDQIRQTVREALAEELAPVLTLLTDPDRHSAAPAQHQDDGLLQQHETVRAIKEELGLIQEETRDQLASLHRKIADLQDAVEASKPEAADGEQAQATQADQEHTELLRTAARVSSALLLCHRDIWEFLTAHAGRHPHFRVPPHVNGEKDERIRAAVSGRSLIALLISLHAIRHTSLDGDGDRELAATLYERISASLTGLAADGEQVTITLDDRLAPAPEEPASPSDEEPDGTAGDTGGLPEQTDDPQQGENTGPDNN
ncbi:hypothetical protein ACFQ9J_26820 [Streptomyces sp. NPDC056529]|uniref:hypothetical protein n=1 Tax=Streptomyces sp. NPDC056529 TaxID=3345855 RepID=UPI0036752E9D